MKSSRYLLLFLFVAPLLLLAQNRDQQSKNKPIGIEFVLVRTGTFQMGSTSRANEAPVHSVTLSQFFIDKMEITFEKWTEVRNWGLTHGYTDLVEGRNGYNGTTNDPVTEVTWYDVVKWCNARSEKEGLTPVYYTDTTLSKAYLTGEIDLTSDAVKWTAKGYRLPTEAEWEFAARGGTSSKGYTYSGGNMLNDVAWYELNSDTTTHAVGTKTANELGIFDMSGNVAEWCWDWYGDYTASSRTNPKGPASGTYRMNRGGTFGGDDGSCRVAFRDNLCGPQNGSGGIGFRCVRN